MELYHKLNCFSSRGWRIGRNQGILQCLLPPWTDRAKITLTYRYAGPQERIDTLRGLSAGPAVPVQAGIEMYKRWARRKDRAPFAQGAEFDFNGLVILITNKKHPSIQNEVCRRASNIIVQAKPRWRNPVLFGIGRCWTDGRTTA
jgi:hypothetical protein